MIDPGQICQVNTSPPLLGTVLSIAEDVATIELMHAVGQVSRREVQLSQLERHRLPRETRAYVRDDDCRWQAWRVGQFDGREYELIRPETARYVSEDRIRVLAGDSPSSPIQILAVRGHESPFFSERRWLLVGEILRLRGLTGRMTGLLSSNVDLFPHQIAVVQRVLNDPVMRYLLADEVGLGKTIEAGMIIRQFLIDTRDDPDANRVAVCVPAALRPQWTAELADRFGLHEFETRIDVWTLETLRVQEVGMLVIDEAHRLGSMAWTQEQQETYDRVRTAAHRSPRVLLLSATPATHHEREYLAMLHLLDPSQYRLEDEEGFRLRIAAREALATSLTFLRDDASNDEILYGLELLEEALSLEGSPVAGVRELVERGAKEREDGLRELRVWLGERYRIHRRLVRSRRSSSAASDYCWRNGQTDRQKAYWAALEGSLDPRSELVTDALECWRERAAGEAETAGESRTSDLARVLAAFLDAAGIGPEFVARAAAARAEHTADPDLEEALGEKRWRALLETPRFGGELPELLNLRDVENGDDGDWPPTVLTAEVVIKELDRARNAETRPRVVVFTSSTESARSIGQAIAAKLGPAACALHLTGMSDSEFATNRARFRDDDACLVLVADRSGEEGANLQFAHRVVHHDLPFDAARIEQRMGRVDRIGQTQAPIVKTIAATPLHEHWATLLYRGFDVFGSSISGSQFAVDNQMERLSRLYLMQGAESLGSDETVTSVLEAMERERRAVVLQDLFDAHELEPEELAFADELATADYSSQGFSSACSRWFEEALHVWRQRECAEGNTFRYDAMRRSLLTAKQKWTLGTYATRTLTYSRCQAVKIPGVDLLRPGRPLIDEMERMLWRDERGKAAVYWRQWRPGEDDDPEPTPLMILRFVQESNIEAVLDHLDAAEATTLGPEGHHAARRVADRVAPPRTDEVILHLRGEPVEERLRTIARRPYAKSSEGGTDTSLDGERVQVLESVVDPQRFVDDMNVTVAAGEAELESNAAVIEWRRAGLERAKREIRRRSTILAARRAGAEARGDAEESSSIERDESVERILGQVVLSAVESVRVVLDSASIVILAGTPVRLPEEET